MQLRPFICAPAGTLARSSCVGTPDTDGHFDGTIESEWHTADQARENEASLADLEQQVLTKANH